MVDATNTFFAWLAAQSAKAATPTNARFAAVYRFRQRQAPTTTPPACSAIFCSTATPDSRSQHSPACSASAGPPLRTSKATSSKEAIQAAHHRLAGRPHGKLLPRYAGPIARVPS